MTAPAMVVPGQVATGAGFSGAGAIAPAAVGEWVDVLPPDDASPIVLILNLQLGGGAGPGIVRIYRVGADGAPAVAALINQHVAPVNVPAVFPAEEYVFTFLRPVGGALRVTYENQSGGNVFPGLRWSYVVPGRR